MARNDRLTLCEQYLFEDKDKLTHLPSGDVDIIIRVRTAYVYMRDFPTKRDREVRDFIMAEFGVQKSVAYEYIKLAQFLVGHFNKNSKDWLRFRTNALIEETREFAKKVKDAGAMARCEANMIKANSLDKEDEEIIDWDKIYIQPFVPTSDPTVIGLKPIPNILQKIESLKKKYFDEIQAVDVEYVDETYKSEDVFLTEEERNAKY